MLLKEKLIRKWRSCSQGTICSSNERFIILKSPALTFLIPTNLQLGNDLLPLGFCSPKNKLTNPLRISFFCLPPPGRFSSRRDRFPRRWQARRQLRRPDRYRSRGKKETRRNPRGTPPVPAVLLHHPLAALPARGNATPSNSVNNQPCAVRKSTGLRDSNPRD